MTPETELATWVARALAARIGWPVRDSDADIEAATGQTVRDIRSDRGGEALWRIEADQCLDALATPGPLIVVPAASTIEDPRCRAALQAASTVAVWLSVPPDVAAERFAAGAHRPWYGDDPAVFIAAQAAARDPLYAAVAALHVRTDQLRPAEIVDRVVAILRTRGAVTGDLGGLSG